MKNKHHYGKALAIFAGICVAAVTYAVWRKVR